MALLQPEEEYEEFVVRISRFKAKRLKDSAQEAGLTMDSLFEDATEKLLIDIQQQKVDALLEESFEEHDLLGRLLAQ